jgi:hypothetical protein
MNEEGKKEGMIIGWNRPIDAGVLILMMVIGE